MSKGNILIVEDDLINANVIKCMLENFDYTISSIVNSGEDAITKALEIKPDLILMDIELKGDINGVSASEKIQSFIDLPVIYVTGHSDKELLEKAKLTSPYGYIIKPFNETELIVNIEMALYKHKMDKKLKESEDLYRSVVSLSPDPVYLLDVGRKIILQTNPSFCRLLGYSSEETHNLTVYDIISSDREIIDRNLEEVIRQKQHFIGETYYRKKEKTLIDTEVYASLITFGGRNVFCIISHDLTERKEFEKELRQRHKMEAIRTMTGGIAHNFNNILASVMGFIEVAMFDIPEGSRPYTTLGQSLNAIDKAKNLILQLITFTFRNKRKEKSIKISVIIKDILELIKASLMENIHFHSNIVSDSSVSIDEDQFEQILINLCENAIYSMRKTGGTLEVNLLDVNIEKGDKSISPGRYVKLTVSDTGCGMDTSIMEKIFDPFFTTRNMAEAKGLGLCIVYGIVDSCGGCIKFHSKAGEGTNFDIYLPVYKVI
jgi:two-component system, cell cycle sensor histidine kinase and response regulator CckA